jgi:hypothetical protein
VFDFMNFRHKDMAPQKFLKSYLWFAGLEHRKNTRQDILSRVDIELINEQIKLFYSDQDVVTITYDEDTLPLLNMFLWVWTIKQVITPRETSPLFYENGYYKIENELFSNHRNLVEKCFIIFTTLTSLC